MKRAAAHEVQAGIGDFVEYPGGGFVVHAVEEPGDIAIGGADEPIYRNGDLEDKLHIFSFPQS